MVPIFRPAVNKHDEFGEQMNKPGGTVLFPASRQKKGFSA
jgi:hypothetical protein